MIRADGRSLGGATVMMTLLATVAGGGACDQHQMSASECGLVLDRIVALELAGDGFRDPVLVARRQSELRLRFASDLTACVGRPASARVMACVAKAASTAEISHACLR